MLETSFSILFYLKKRQGYTQGELPIYMRLTVNGARKEIGTKHSIESERWNNHSQRAKGGAQYILKEQWLQIKVFSL